MGNSLIKLFAVVLTVGSILLGSAPQARAIAVPWGDPVLGHSWVQFWTLSSDDIFDMVVARISAPPAASFEAPGFFNFSAGSWSILSETAQSLEAHGPGTFNLEVRTHFVGLPDDYSVANPLILDFNFSYLELSLTKKQYIWNGSSWSPPQSPPQVVEVAASGRLSVPDGGATLLLLGVSLMGMSTLFRRKRA